MNIDTITFLYLIPGGFFAIWSYRYFQGRKNKLNEFEYLVFSLFWGILIVGFIAWRSGAEKFSIIMSNPLGAFIALSFVGALFGSSIAIGMKIGDWSFNKVVEKK